MPKTVYSRDNYLNIIKPRLNREVWKLRTGTFHHDFEKHTYYKNFTDFINNKVIKIVYKEGG